MLRFQIVWKFCESVRVINGMCFIDIDSMVRSD